MKVTVMLVVSLRGVNCRFWSHLEYLGHGKSLKAMQKEIKLQKMSLH